MPAKLSRTGLALACALAPLQPAAQELAPPLGADERAALHAEIRSYLLANPEILMEMMALLDERKAAETAATDRELVATHAGAIFDDGFSFVGGNPDGGFTIVEFLDYQCTYCRRAHPDVMELIAADGDIRWIVKELPILGPQSVVAARAAIATLIAAGPEAYARVNDALMRLDGPLGDARLDRVLADAGLDPAAIRAGMQDPEVERRIAETRALAETLQISGTPTFVFDAQLVRGYVPLAAMEDLVAEIRAAD